MSISPTHTSKLPLECSAKASDLIYAGRYEEACKVLSPWWRGVGLRPQVESLPPEEVAEILLQCACLSGFLGSERGLDVQEECRDQLTEALGLFESQGNLTKIAETRYELGICYFRNGAYDEAKVLLSESETCGGASPELQGKIIIGRAMVAIYSGQYQEGEDILLENEGFFAAASHALQGRWYNHLGAALKKRGEAKPELLEQAIDKYLMAIEHYRAAGHIRYCGRNLNNLANALSLLGRYQEAYKHLDAAEKIFSDLRDRGALAQARDTRARILMAQERWPEAKQAITGAIDILSRSGEFQWWIDALLLKARIELRLNSIAQSAHSFRQAIALGEHSGARFNAGLAALSFMEEHKLSDQELLEVYLTADRFLAQTDDAAALKRLRTCARRLARQLNEPELGEGFNLLNVVPEYEARFIREALRRSGGRLTGAARLLGIRYQTLSRKLAGRHQKLIEKRTPPVPRRK